MQRYYQTIARLLSGFTMLAMLSWFMWPSDTRFLDREEALFAFLIATVVWIFTEFKESEEVIFRASTKNDIRLARELVSYSADIFKTQLKDHDYHNSLEKEYLSEASSLVHDHDTGIAFFQDKTLKPKFSDFCHSLDKFSSYLGEHSTPELIAGHLRTSIVPNSAKIYSSADRYQEEIQETNRLAYDAWNKLVPLIKCIRERVPEAFDEPIEYRWFRTKNRYE